MYLLKTSPSGRSKRIADRRGSTRPFFKWSASLGRYEFMLELYNSSTGEKFTVVGSQIEWAAAIEELNTRFGEAPG